MTEDAAWDSWTEAFAEKLPRAGRRKPLTALTCDDVVVILDGYLVYGGGLDYRLKGGVLRFSDDRKFGKQRPMLHISEWGFRREQLSKRRRDQLDRLLIEALAPIRPILPGDLDWWTT